MVILRNLSFRSYTSLESALIAQTAQKVRDGQTDPQTKRAMYRCHSLTDDRGEVFSFYHGWDAFVVLWVLEECQEGTTTTSRSV